MTKYLLAHDIGTSGDKAALFREDGTLIKSIIREYPTYYSCLLYTSPAVYSFCRDPAAGRRV